MDASAATSRRTPTIDQTAEHHRERRMAAVVCTVDAESTRAAALPASIPPRAGPARALRRLVAEMGMRGAKFHY
ncbi:MAG TPA: hypothetical protein VFR74_09145 [Jiangellales bacterium]|nr:hypothetical protein [Jiangellales bacterium]